MAKILSLFCWAASSNSAISSNRSVLRLVNSVALEAKNTKPTIEAMIENVSALKNLVVTSATAAMKISNDDQIKMQMYLRTRTPCN